MPGSNSVCGEPERKIFSSRTLPHLASPYKGEGMKKAGSFSLAFCQEIDKHFHLPSALQFIDTQFGQA